MCPLFWGLNPPKGNSTQYKGHLASSYIYHDIYSPNDLYFWRVNPPKQSLSQSKTRGPPCRVSRYTYVCFPCSFSAYMSRRPMINRPCWRFIFHSYCWWKKSHSQPPWDGAKTLSMVVQTTNFNRVIQGFLNHQQHVSLFLRACLQLGGCPSWIHQPFQQIVHWSKLLQQNPLLTNNPFQRWTVFNKIHVNHGILVNDADKIVMMSQLDDLLKYN